MKTDCDYQIGATHQVCQDYAVAGHFTDSGAAYAIVSDGCSSSEDVDFGARLLALAGREILQVGGIVDVAPGVTWDHVGPKSIYKAHQVKCYLPCVRSQALDATLLFAYVTPQYLAKACLFGDGVFVHGRAGLLKVLHVSYTSGAPYYLNYLLYPDRKQKYEEEANKPKVLTRTVHHPDGQTDIPNIEEFEYKAVVEAEFRVEPGDVLAVISDGINSYKKGDDTHISYLDIVGEFVRYKTTEGIFAKRRLSAFARKCKKEQVTHGDDISIASIIVT